MKYTNTYFCRALSLSYIELGEPGMAGPPIRLDGMEGEPELPEEEPPDELTGP